MGRRFLLGFVLKGSFRCLLLCREFLVGHRKFVFCSTIRYAKLAISPDFCAVVDANVTAIDIIKIAVSKIVASFLLCIFFLSPVINYHFLYLELIRLTLRL